MSECKEIETFAHAGHRASRCTIKVPVWWSGLRKNLTSFPCKMESHFHLHPTFSSCCFQWGLVFLRSSLYLMSTYKKASSWLSLPIWLKITHDAVFTFSEQIRSNPHPRDLIARENSKVLTSTMQGLVGLYGWNKEVRGHRGIQRHSEGRAGRMLVAGNHPVYIRYRDRCP